MTADEGLSALVQMFEESEQSTRDARKLSERDRDYYDNKQWTADEISALEKRKQPVVTYNRIARKIDFLSGLEKQQRKDPKAFPRTPNDEAAAQAATDAIRYVCDDADWDAKRSAAWDDLLIEGTCAVLVGHKAGRSGNDPDIVHIPWDRFFYDPKSSKPDFSDARYMGIVTWYDLADAKAKGWPEDALSGSMAHDADTQTYDDKPKEKMWADAKRKRVRVVELYHREGGTWMRCVFTCGGYLEPKGPSPYIGEDGQPENPIKAMSLYVDRENNRYGAVRVLISPQDEINKRRSKGLHLITMRQFRISHASSVEKEELKRELAKPDGGITAEQGDFEILNTNDMAAQNFNMLQEAKNEIDLLGANAALAGKNENDMSGRAILAQQNGGMVEVARMFDRLRALSIAVYRSTWNRVRQLWTGERWIRITDDPRNMRFVGLNQQVTVAQIAQEVAEGKPEGMESAAKIVGPQLLQAYMAGDEQARMVLGQFVQMNGQQVAETRNAVTELDVDIVIDEGMDTPTVQAEQFDTLVKMLPGLGAFGQSPQMMEMIIQASSLREKDKLLEMVKPKEGAPQQSPEEMMARQAEAETAAAKAKAEIDAQARIEVAKIAASADIEVAQIKVAAESEAKAAQMQAESQLNERAAETEAQLQERKMLLDHSVRAKVADATGEARKAQEADAKKASDSEAQMAIMAKLADLLAEMNRPKMKVPVRDENGFIVGIEERAA